jgi:hypothetical protein
MLKTVARQERLPGTEEARRTGKNFRIPNVNGYGLVGCSSEGAVI